MKAILSILRPVTDRLGFRLAAVLAVALLPLMIVSIVRSQSVVNEALARSQAALDGETLRAVQEQIILIERAKAVSQTLSHIILDLLEDPDVCSRMMKEVIRDTDFSFAGFYDTTGYVPCSSADEPFSIGMTPSLVRQIADPIPTVLVYEDAPISGVAVVYGSYPVVSTDGQLLGFTSISVPQYQLRSLREGRSDAQFLTFNAAGTILTAPGTLEEAENLLPVLTPWQTINALPESFEDIGGDGVPRLYSVVPVVEGEIFALATWPSSDEVAGEGFYFSYPALFPFLMWLASLAVAWFATSLFVTRHVVRLRQTMTEFASDRRMPVLEEFKDAPIDLREVASAYYQMTDIVLREEARIEDAMRQKDILLREVHHRVKNNLQLITSIMSMQMRQSRSPEVKLLLRGLHDRVNSLATIHRSLYQTTGQADVQMDEHLKSIVEQVVRMGADRASTISVRTDFAPLHLNPDQAVPLSLFVTEAMTNALKYIGPDKSGGAWLEVRLQTRGADRASVHISNSLPVDLLQLDEERSTGLGSELMEAFSHQLGGDITRQQSPGRFDLELSFEVEELNAKP